MEFSTIYKEFDFYLQHVLNLYHKIIAVIIMFFNHRMYTFNSLTRNLYRVVKPSMLSVFYRDGTRFTILGSPFSNKPSMTLDDDVMVKVLFDKV